MTITSMPASIAFSMIMKVECPPSIKRTSIKTS